MGVHIKINNRTRHITRSKYFLDMLKAYDSIFRVENSLYARFVMYIQELNHIHPIFRFSYQYENN